MISDQSLDQIANTPLDDRNRELLLEALHTLAEHPHADEFFNPLDWKGNGFLDYLEIISIPMDLRSIIQHLENREYDRLWEVVQDVTFVFDNCKRFHGPQTVYWVYAHSCLLKFRELLRTSCSSLGIVTDDVYDAVAEGRFDSSSSPGKPMEWELRAHILHQIMKKLTPHRLAHLIQFYLRQTNQKDPFPPDEEGIIELNLRCLSRRASASVLVLALDLLVDQEVNIALTARKMGLRQ